MPTGLERPITRMSLSLPLQPCPGDRSASGYAWRRRRPSRPVVWASPPACWVTATARSA